MGKSETSQLCLHTLIWTHLSTNESTATYKNKLYKHFMTVICVKPEESCTSLHMSQEAQQLELIPVSVTQSH